MEHDPVPLFGIAVGITIMIAVVVAGWWWTQSGKYRSRPAVARPKAKVQRPRPVRVTPDDDAMKTPSRPSSFGNCEWLAVRSNSADAVREALGLVDAIPCNWARGIEGAYKGDTFVSPPLGVAGDYRASTSWVLVVSSVLPGLELVERLSRELDTEVQYFFSTVSESSEVYGWARARQGTVRRAHDGTGGLIFKAVGKADQAEEKAFKGALGQAMQKAESLPGPKVRMAFPWKDAVMKLAEQWSIDPHTLETREDEGVGWLGASLKAD
jgi:hypothetical protein